MGIDEIQAMIDNDPDLQEWVNNLLLRFNLRLMSDAIASGKSVVTERETIARKLAHEEANTLGSPALENGIYTLLIGYAKALK